jgi:hypothetical protein
MGQKATILEKKPELMEAALSDIRLLKMLGLKQTQLEPGYTKRYDHGLIPIKALEELVKSPNFNPEDLEFKSSKPELDMSQLNEMMKNVDMSKMSEMVKDNEQLSKLVKDVDISKLSEINKDTSESIENTENTESFIEEVVEEEVKEVVEEPVGWPCPLEVANNSITE